MQAHEVEHIKRSLDNLQLLLLLLCSEVAIVGVSVWMVVDKLYAW